MSFATLLAGELPSAAKWATILAEVRPQYVPKASDEQVNNTTGLQNDNEIVAAVLANTTYEIFLRLVINTNSTADFKYQFTGPAGATMTTHVFTGSNPDTAASGLQGPTNNLTTPAAISGVGADQVVVVQGLVIVAGTAGNLQLQWAQNTANVSNTIVRGGTSYMILRKLS